MKNRDLPATGFLSSECGTSSGLTKILEQETE